MSIEYAGVVEVEPPLRGAAVNWACGALWSPSRDGTTIRPQAGVGLEPALRGIREIVDLDIGRVYGGVVAAYDADSRVLSTITVRDGRVTRRTLRKPAVRERSNVIDLAAHHRTISRQIG